MARHFTVSLKSAATPACFAYHYIVIVAADDVAAARAHAYEVAMAFLRERRGDPAGLRIVRVAAGDPTVLPPGAVYEFRVTRD